MPVKTQWFGDKVMRDAEKAFMAGVNKSNHQNFVGIDNAWPVLTGFSKGQLKEIPAVHRGDKIFALVAANADYSVHIEIKDKPMRRTAKANENRSLKNFEGTLK